MNSFEKYFIIPCIFNVCLDDILMHIDYVSTHLPAEVIIFLSEKL